MSHAAAAVKTNSFSGLIANFAPQLKKVDSGTTLSELAVVHSRHYRYVLCNWNLNSSICMKLFDKNNA